LIFVKDDRQLVDSNSLIVENYTLKKRSPFSPSPPKSDRPLPKDKKRSQFSLNLTKRDRSFKV
jgi:hypothetical protein